VFGRLRCGCYLALVAAAVLLWGAAVLLWLVTRDIGPSFRDGAYTVQAPDGTARVDQITPQAAASFEAKVPAPAGTLDVSRLGVTDLARLRLSGITFSEEEVNAELARRLAAKPVQGDGVTVDRLFLELHPQNSRAYLYTRVYGVKVTFSARVSFSVQNQQARATLSDIHAGKMPIGFILPELLDWTGNTAALENRLALTLPSQVTAIQTREGQLHVDVDPLRFGRGGPASPPALTAAAAPPARSRPLGVALLTVLDRRGRGGRLSLRRRRARRHGLRVGLGGRGSATFAGGRLLLGCWFG